MWPHYHYIYTTEGKSRTEVLVNGGVLFLQVLKDMDPFQMALPCFEGDGYSWTECK